MTQARSLLILACTFVLAHGEVRGQAGPDTVRLTATIVSQDGGRPLFGAILQLSGHSDRWVTDIDGRAEFEVPVGEYVLYAERAGYETLEGEFKVFRPGDFTLRLQEVDLDDPWAPGRLVGTVVDAESGQPLEGVDVSLLPRGRAITDGRGRFVFDDLSPGLNRLSFERLGYSEREDPVSVQPGRTTAVEVRMTVTAIELPPITVEVRSRHLELNGVYRRMERGTSGQYLTRAQFEQRVSNDLSDSFYTVPGVQVIERGTMRILEGRGGCRLRIFIDGVQVQVGQEDFVNIDDFPPEWIEIAEVYPGPASTPIQYTSPKDDCGVVLIWTRRAGGE